jgi:HPt (histidine-containing phosphotransfer) domain-containing protein
MDDTNQAEIAVESSAVEELLDQEYHRKNYHDLGCSDVLLDVYRIYLESAPQKIEQLRPVVERGEFDPIISLAHGLKGESGSIGGRLVMATAAALEMAARAGNLQEVHRLMPELELQLQRTIAAIEQELAA